MTGMDDSDPAVDDAWEDDGAAPQPDTEAEPQLQPLDLLVWDAPNIDMTLSNVIGARPSPASRPRFDAVARWLVDGAGDRDVEGSVFTNVPPGAATGMRGWIEALRSFGYAVFAKPKLHHDDDVDLAMLEHIDERIETWWKTSPDRNYWHSYIGPAGAVGGLAPEDMFRAFDPDTSIVTFRGDTVVLNDVIAELERVLLASAGKIPD